MQSTAVTVARAAIVAHNVLGCAYVAAQELDDAQTAEAVAYLARRGVKPVRHSDGSHMDCDGNVLFLRS